MNGQHIIVATNYEERAMKCLQNAQFIDLVLPEHDLGGGYSLQCVRYDPVTGWLQIGIVNEAGTGTIDLSDMELYVDGILLKCFNEVKGKAFYTNLLTILIDRIVVRRILSIRSNTREVAAIVVF